METSRQFQEYADECERLAEETTSEDQRRTLRKIATAWRRIAEEREHQAHFRRPKQAHRSGHLGFGRGLTG